MRESFDVLIIGGGPAGGALAIALVHLGRTVAILEQSHYDEARTGETLPPRIQLPLKRLGLWDRFVADGHAPSPAILSVWGGEQLQESHFLFNPYGQGWHVDRRHFDKMLVQSAEEAGASVCRGARVTACLPSTPHGWQVFTSEGKGSGLQAGLLVDASGRAAVAARGQGAKRIAYDRLIGIVGWFDARSQTVKQDSRLLLEAVAEGWWYSAWLPNSQLVVAHMTDADLIARDRVSRCKEWQTRLDQAPHTRARLKGCFLQTGLRIAAANSCHMEPVSGDDWLAIGDAATAFDPLSSLGIYNALQSAILAAQAIEERRIGNPQALQEYAFQSRRNFDEYLQMRTQYYGMETRWPSSAFWQRRREKLQ